MLNQDHCLMTQSECWGMGTEEVKHTRRMAQIDQWPNGLHVHNK